jgi:hypothetical protein
MTVAQPAATSRIRQRDLLTGLISGLIALVAASSLTGLLTSGGPGRLHSSVPAAIVAIWGLISGREWQTMTVLTMGTGNSALPLP